MFYYKPLTRLTNVSIIGIISKSSLFSSGVKFILLVMGVHNVHDATKGTVNFRNLSNTVKEKYVSPSLRFIVPVLGILFFTYTTASGQCNPPQEAPDCNDCVAQKYDITICHGNTNYQAHVVICTQYAGTLPLDNPCTPNCDRAVDAISWVREICVPQALKDLGLTAIYAAIVRGTNLCCNDFLGAKPAWPFCSSGSTCKTSTTAYCHILALPKCLRKDYVNGCYYSCQEKCQDYCMIERRYCKFSPTECCSALMDICDFNNDSQCTGSSCNVQFDNCSALTTELCCD